LCITLCNYAALTSIGECSKELHWWYSFNGLQLNPAKPDAILIGSQARLRRESAVDELKLANVSVKLAQSTKSRGVTIDNKLTLVEHASNV